MALSVARMAWLWPALWLVALAAEVAAGGAAVWLAGAHGPALVAAAVNLLIGLRFAATLRPGRVPLITRYARCDVAGLPARAEGYTRALTALWAWLLGFFALAQAAAMVGLWGTGAVSALEAGVCAALFLGEHRWRSRRFPELGRATPWRTLRAIRLAAGAPHAA